MPMNEAPSWVREFLEKKAPWWLEGDGQFLEVTIVDSNRRIAQVQRFGFTYTLIPERFQIA
jgi:hypothetical protein